MLCLTFIKLTHIYLFILPLAIPTHSYFFSCILGSVLEKLPGHSLEELLWPRSETY